MTNHTFSESEIRFKFPDDWFVFKYDEHRFYRYLSGEGLKGVDFIAIHQERLILIEVKSYAIRFKKENYDPMSELLSDPSSYAKKYLRKFEDTFRLLDIIDQYYNRKWWYRKLFQPLKSYFSQKYILKTETGFWSKAIEILKKEEAIKLVLWLELAPDCPKTEADRLYHFFQNEIQSKITKGQQFIIAHSKQTYNDIIAQIENHD